MTESNGDRFTSARLALRKTNSVLKTSLILWVTSQVLIRLKEGCDLQGRVGKSNVIGILNLVQLQNYKWSFNKIFIAVCSYDFSSSNSSIKICLHISLKEKDKLSHKDASSNFLSRKFSFVQTCKKVMTWKRRVRQFYMSSVINRQQEWDSVKLVDSPNLVSGAELHIHFYVSSQTRQ